MRLRRVATALVASALLGACHVRSVALDGKWLPLARLVETGIEPRHAVTTLASTVFVHSLAELDAEYPVGVSRDALLTHEREHARRQAGYRGGLAAWVVLYVTDRPFRWQEEQAGWELELRCLVRAGRYVDQASVTRTLSGPLYSMPWGEAMVEPAAAAGWVASVVIDEMTRPRGGG